MQIAILWDVNNLAGVSGFIWGPKRIKKRSLHKQYKLR